MVFDVSSTSRFAYITITIKHETSAKLCLFQQCTSNENDWDYVTGSVPQDGSTLNASQHDFWYNYTIINCLLTIFVHNYSAQPICCTYVSKYCESLTDWSIPLSARD